MKKMALLLFLSFTHHFAVFSIDADISSLNLLRMNEVIETNFLPNDF